VAILTHADWKICFHHFDEMRACWSKAAKERRRPGEPMQPDPFLALCRRAWAGERSAELFEAMASVTQEGPK
jgi:hypothetical protein